MSSKLTEEQRQRMEANRKRALEKKNQRLQSQNGAFDYDEVPPPINNSSARESFGDSNIDWEEAFRVAAAAEAQVQSTNNAPHKRKLDNTNDAINPSFNHFNSEYGSSRELSSNENIRQYNRVNSNSVHSESNTQNNCSTKSQLTEDQKARIELNRQRALEKKQRAANKQIVVGSSGYVNKLDVPTSTNEQGVEEKQETTTFSASTVNCSSLTDDQRYLIEQKRQLALQKKQSSLVNSQIHRNILPSGIGQNESYNPTAALPEKQKVLIEQKRLAALRKKQALLSSNNASHVQPSGNYSLGQQMSREQTKSYGCQKASLSILEPNSYVQPTAEKNPIAKSSEQFSYEQQTSVEQKSNVLGDDSTMATEQQNGTYELKPASSNPKYASPAEEQYALLGEIAGLGKNENVSCLSSDRHLSKKQQPAERFVSSPVPLVNSDRQQTPTKPAAIFYLPASSALNKVEAFGDTLQEHCKNHFETAKATQSDVDKAAKDVTKELKLPPIPTDIQYDSSRCQPIDDETTDSLIENAELDQPLLNGWSLYEHQKEGVLRAIRMRRLILAFDMGLGKTIIGCVWSKAFLRSHERMKVFVITPVSLMEDWSRTAAEATGLSVHDGKKKPKKKKGKKRAASDYASDDSEEKSTKKRRGRKKATPDDAEEDVSNIDMFIFSWSNVIGYKSITIENPECDYIVICDEAHNMQSMTSKRTEDALTLISGKRCKGVLLLSGTPMKNGKPSNLFPLLRAVKHPFGDHQRRYEFYFCNGQNKFMGGREVWDASGSSNLKELHAHTSSHIFRMTKDECMSKELTPKKREYIKISVSSRHELRYSQALKELARAWDCFQASKGEQRSYDINENNILTPFNQLRQASSYAKIDATVVLANDILKSEESIVIFTSFVAVAKEIRQELESMGWDGKLLTGEVAADKRQAMVDDFQSGVTPVFVCTYGAGGVGLTLTAACTVVLVDRPWTPGDVNQAEDRVRRIGQKRSVRSIWIRAFPIDEQIDALIDQKEVNSSTAVDGRKEGHGQNRSAPKISIGDLVKTALSTQT